MNRPREVDVSLYDNGNYELKIWSASFTIRGVVNRKDGKIDEEDRLRIEKQIEKVILSLDFDEPQTFFAKMIYRIKNWWKRR